METHLPILLIAVPLVAAPLMVLIGNRTLVMILSIAVAWSVFAIAVGLMGQVLEPGNGVIEYALGDWPSPYGIVYRIDSFNAFVMLFVSALGAIVLTYAPVSIDQQIPRSKHYLFYTSYLLCLTGLLGMCVTGDLFNVFVFLEISSLSSYALISLGKNRRAPLAAFQYLILGTIGATFFLLGIGLLYQITGTLNMADIADRLAIANTPRAQLVAFAFMTVGLCIKMAVFPLHTWLPNAYTYAPSVVTSFIAATATKVSVYAFARLVFTIYTPKFAFETLPLGEVLTVFALVGIFVASGAAIYQYNVKRLLAYSSVAQIGYMLLGISLATELGLSAGIVHMFNHALIKGGLFMVVGCFALRIGSVRIGDLCGAAKTMPWTSFAWVVGGLGLIGVPLTAGFVSKWMLLKATMEQGRWPVAVLMLISSLLAVVYVWKVVEALYFSEPSEKAKHAKEAPALMLVPTYLVIGLTILFGCWSVFSAGLANEAAKALLMTSMGGAP
ncbi:MAG: monovalent cation/H+ antiporter subunit D family protein [Planctomycetota bacterium]